MKANQIETGCAYAVRVGNRICRVTVLRAHSRRGWQGQSLRGWTCRNESTGRTIEVKSAQRFRHVWGEAAPPEPKRKPASKPDVDLGKAWADSGLEDPMRRMLSGQLLKWACGMQICCPYTGQILDCRSAVLLTVYEARTVLRGGNGHKPVFEKVIAADARFEFVPMGSGGVANPRALGRQA